MIRDSAEPSNFVLNRDQVVIDIRAVLPSTVAVRSITNRFTKGNIQGNMLRDLIEEREQKEKEERDRRIF